MTLTSMLHQQVCVADFQRMVEVYGNDQSSKQSINKIALTGLFIVATGLQPTVNRLAFLCLDVEIIR